MNKYYMTYGEDDSMPFQGGWSVIYAETENEARKKHADKYGLSKEGCLRFAFSYTEERWAESNMEDDGNCGKYEQEVIR